MRQRRIRRALHLSPYNKCAFVADIFDDSRLAIWQAIRTYEIAEAWDSDDLRRDAIYLLRSQDWKLDHLVAEALAYIEGIPDFPEVEEAIHKAVGEFRRQMEAIRHKMETRRPYDEIADQQMDEYERQQFDFQHKLFQLCLEKWWEEEQAG